MVRRPHSGRRQSRSPQGGDVRSEWLCSVVLGAVLTAPLWLAGCTPQNGTYAGPVPPSIPQSVPGEALPPLSGPAVPAQAERPVAILAPLSGPNAERGSALVNAAALALADPGSPKLDVRDTTGTPAGAASAAQAAVAAGDGIIVGPLTGAETAAVAPVARAANIPVLAFTNDPAMQQPGVWTLGITPGEQVRRLVDAMTAQGKDRFAAVLPEGAFGRAMSAAYTQATQQAGAGVPTIRVYRPGNDASVDKAVRDVSAFVQRGGVIPAPASVAPTGTASGDQAGQAAAPAPAPEPAAPVSEPTLPPPPIDALLLADTGQRLAYVTTQLSADQVTPPAVRVLGPDLWIDPGARAGAALDGAWFAAPDPSSPARAAFNRAYSDKYGVAAPGVSDFAFDAATIAKAVAGTGYAASALTTPTGFPGVDGPIALRPDGQVRRGLALFEVDGGTARVAEPAPQILPPPAS